MSSKEEGCIGMRVTGWCGQGRGTGAFQLNLFTMLWSPVTLYCSQEASFGDTVHHLRWCFFVWEATWGRILTLGKVQRRGFSLVNKCFLCHFEE